MDIFQFKNKFWIYWRCCFPTYMYMQPLLFKRKVSDTNLPRCILKWQAHTWAWLNYNFPTPNDVFGINCESKNVDIHNVFDNHNATCVLIWTTERWYICKYYTYFTTVSTSFIRVTTHYLKLVCTSQLSTTMHAACGSVTVSYHLRHTTIYVRHNCPPFITVSSYDTLPWAGTS